MSQLEKGLDEDFARLRQKRDELLVQLNLGKKEARDAWDQLEKKWSRLEARMEQVRREGADVAEDVKGALETLSEEVRAGFERVRKLL